MSSELGRDVNTLEDNGSDNKGYQTAAGDQNGSYPKTYDKHEGQITLDDNRSTQTLVSNQREDATVICIEDIIKEIEDYVHINSEDENESQPMTISQHYLGEMVSDENGTQISAAQNVVQVSLNSDCTIPTGTQTDISQPKVVSARTKLQNEESIVTNGEVLMNFNVEEVAQNTSTDDQLIPPCTNNNTDLAISPPYSKNNSNIQSEVQNTVIIPTDDVTTSNKETMASLINDASYSQKVYSKNSTEYSEVNELEKEEVNTAPIFCTNVEQEEIGLSTAEEIEIRNIIEMAEKIYAESDNEMGHDKNEYKEYTHMEEHLNNSYECEAMKVDSSITKKVKTKGTIKPEHVKTEEYMTVSNYSDKVQNEDEEYVIGLSTAEELEIHAIIERAEVEYAKTEEKICGDSGKIITKKVVDDFRKIQKMDIEQSSTNGMSNEGRKIVTYDDIELEDKKNVENNLVNYDDKTIKQYKYIMPKNDQSWFKGEQLAWWKSDQTRKYQEYHDGKVKCNVEQSKKDTKSTVPGNTKNDAISLEDKELIMELVSIAVGEKPVPDNNSQEYSALDKRGQIIKEFVKEYFEKCEAKSGNGGGRRYNNYTYSSEYRGHQRLYPRSYLNKYSPENMNISRGDKKKVTMRNDGEMIHEIPRSTVGLDSPISFSPEGERERLLTEQINAITLKWEFEDDTLVCKTTKGEQDRNDGEMIHEIPRSTVRRDSPPSSPEGERERLLTEQINAIKLKWELEEDTLVCKTTKGEQDSSRYRNRRADEDDWLKTKQERKRSFSLKDLPMNERGGHFFVDRTLVPVDLYQDGLLVHQWKPTSVLNEICAKSGWTLPVFTVVNCTEEGYLVSVNVNGQEFYPSFRGQTKRAARHLASVHFLKCIGFQCKEEYNQYLAMNLNDRARSEVKSSNRKRSVSLESIKIHEKNEESSRSKSRRCHILSNPRSISSETNERDIYEEKRKNDSVEVLWSRSDAAHCNLFRSISPSVKGKYQTNQSLEGNSKGRPPTWEKLDEIPPFVPRQRQTSARYPHTLLPTPRTPTPRKCRCKLSFPHPSIHPWRYEMKAQNQSMVSVKRKI